MALVGPIFPERVWRPVYRPLSESRRADLAHCVDPIPSEVATERVEQPVHVGLLFSLQLGQFFAKYLKLGLAHAVGFHPRILHESARNTKRPAPVFAH